MRFKSLIQRSPFINQQVVYWEEQLNHLTDRLQPINPPNKLWKTIYGRLFSPHQRGFDFWHWFGAVGSAAAVVLAIFLVQQTVFTPDTADTRVAVIQNEQQKSLWVLSISANSIDVVPQRTIEPYLDKDYQLWMLPADGSNPVSLGLLPEQGDATALSPPDAFKLAKVGGLAVSLEPAGGSPTGLPTGPVLYTTDIAQL
ncbi:anti-sigma factor [Idiomarina abyssalis]|uniref:anti-sigma factor n=1 Tax=Idiomarina abyssalis TaxID=86102 RepID=UPI002301509D|nr:anti-sigma factor [Idiomarina abyssalis]MDA6067761.1 anti-sigma factor [Idiomarina abyssalis]